MAELSSSPSRSPLPVADSHLRLLQYIEQVKVKIDKFARLVNFAQNRPSDDPDPDEAEVRLRMASTRIPALQKQIDQLQEFEESLTRFYPEQDVDDETDEIANKIETLLDTYERMKQTFYLKINHRPDLKNDIFPNASIPGSFDNGRQTHEDDSFNPEEFVRTKFFGDQNDRDYLRHYQRWKADWKLAYEKFRSRPGFNSSVAFKLLTSVVGGSALKKIEHLNPHSVESYEEAISILDTVYASKLNLAANCLLSLENVHGNDHDLADAFDKSLADLLDIEKTFDQDNTDRYQFSVLLNCMTRMNSRPKMARSWQDFKEQQLESHGKAKETGLKWHPAMVENLPTFKTWLDDFRASNDATKWDPVSASGSSSAPTKSEKLHCFVCQANHQTSRCPTALAMTVTEWQQVCKVSNKCFRCLGFWKIGHMCNKVCKFCDGPHFVVICRFNKFRPDYRSPRTKRRSSSRDVESRSQTGNSQSRNQIQSGSNPIRSRSKLPRRL